MTIRELPKEILARAAIVYVRQSTGGQVQGNLESQRRQYALVDLARQYGFHEVSVGISHDTGEFAVESIRTWWREMGAPLYPHASSLVITADGGGSNGYRRRLAWSCLKGVWLANG